MASPTREEILSELQNRVSANHPDADMIKQALAGTSIGGSTGSPTGERSAVGNTVPMTQQLSAQDLNNSPSGQYAQQANFNQANPTPYQATPNQTPEESNGMDINSLLKRLQVTPAQGISNAMSVLGGGKPIYDPNMANEFLKQGGALKYAMAPYQAEQIGAKANLERKQASYVAPKAEAGINKDVAQTRLFNTQSGDVGQDGSQRQPGQPLSGDYENMAQLIAKGSLSADSVTQRYPGLRASILQRVSEINPNFQGQTYGATEAGMKGLVKPLETQNAKVDSGLHALRVMDQNFNPQTGQFDIAKMNKAELDQNLAAVISGQGPSSDARVEGVRQSSLSGTLMDKIGYLIGQPVNVVTPEIAKLLHQTLIGQIKQSSQEREPYKQQLGISKFGNDPEDYFSKSPSYQYYYGQGQSSQPNQSTSPYNQQSNGISQIPKEAQALNVGLGSPDPFAAHLESQGFKVIRKRPKNG